jgi:hypothetical protein
MLCSFYRHTRQFELCLSLVLLAASAAFLPKIVPLDVFILPFVSEAVFLAICGNDKGLLFDFGYPETVCTSWARYDSENVW